ncbi:hypothetical protein MASR2M78_37420 [Treponema sp.]
MYLAIGLALIPAFLIIVFTAHEYGQTPSKEVIAETARQAESFVSIQEVITESARQLLRTLAALPEI